MINLKETGVSGNPVDLSLPSKVMEALLTLSRIGLRVTMGEPVTPFDIAVANQRVTELSNEDQELLSSKFKATLEKCSTRVDIGKD